MPSSLPPGATIDAAPVPMPPGATVDATPAELPPGAIIDSAPAQDSAPPKSGLEWWDNQNRPYAENTIMGNIRASRENVKGLVKGAGITLAGALEAQAKPTGMAQMDADPVRQKVRDLETKAAHFLRPYLQLNNPQQKAGNLIETLGEYFLPGVGEEAAAADVTNAAAKAGVLHEILSTAARKTKVLAEHPDILESILRNRATHAATSGVQTGIRASAEMGAQTYAKSGGDPEQTKESMKSGLLWGTVLGVPGAAGVRYLQDLRSGLIPKASGLIESLFGTAEEAPRPLQPAPPPTTPRPIPPEPITTPERLMPAAPTAVRAPLKPTVPAPEPPTQRPAIPIRPAPIPAPEPIEPTSVPEPPARPEPYDAGRAPAAERLAAKEQELARETVAQKFAREAQTRAGDIGDEGEAATHLENLNKAIESEDFVNQPPEQQAQFLEARQELLRRAQPAADPRSASDVLNEVNDLGDAIDVLRKRPIEAYQDWNEQTGGLFNTHNSVYSKTRGKFDADSIEKRNEAEAELMNLWKSHKVAAPIDRAVYRAQFADSYVLEDADKAITNSFKGAERTGDLDPKSLQRNWKSFVNKTGPERAKNVLGEERYHSMNEFVNDMAGEDEADKLINSQIRTDYSKRMAAHRDVVKNAKTLDEARQAALDAQHEAAVSAQQEAHQTERQLALTGIRNARIQDRVTRARQLTEYQKAHQQWQSEVLHANTLNEAQQAAYKAERDEVAAHNQAIFRAKQERAKTIKGQRQAYTEAQAQRAETHNKAIEDWRQDVEDWRTGKQASARRRFVGQLVRSGLNIKAAPWFIIKTLMTNPTAYKVMAHAAAVGTKPELILPIIKSMSGGQQQPTIEGAK